MRHFTVVSFPFFVVGCPRSGTTLLRSMLDGHPRLAIPPESHFVVTLWPRGLRPDRRLDATLERVVAHPRFQAWGLEPEVVREAVRSAAPASYAELISAIFGAYADAHGKPRWGDKTPLYGLHIPRLAMLFPDARFVHIIRDGRNVAASLAASPRGAPTAVTGACWWQKWVRRTRRHGARLSPDRYLEVRYEALVAAPATVLAEVCRFLDEQYDPAMLDYPQAVRSGSTLVSIDRHPNLVLEPRAAIRDWRTGLSPRHRRAVEAVACRQLTALGYPAEPPDPGAYAIAWALRAWGLSRTWPRTVDRTLHRATRSL